MDLRLCLFLLATTVAKPQENISPECSLETDGFCDDGQEQTVESVELDQTIPKILLVGPTGSGKSSMANSLLGLDPENEDAMFPVCMDMDSCTKETTYAEGKWLGSGERFIVVDTPGLQDSDGQDNKLIREMVDVLKNKVKTVDCIVLLIEGKTERFHAGLTTQLRQLSTMFGERWWDFLLIGVSKWEYDEKTIRKRERKCVPGKKSCKDEKWFKRNILHQLENKFNQKRSFDFAFIHSYSQIEDNKDDESEQKHWKEETDKLWSFVKSKNSSSFELKGVDDILEDNRRLKRQVEEYENTIDTEIADLKGEMQMIKETHDSELNQLKNNTLGEIQTIKETHNSELNQLKYDTLGQIHTNKKALDTEIEQVKSNTKSNADKIQANKKTLDTEMEQVNIDTKSNADKIQANKKTLDTEMEQVNIYTKSNADKIQANKKTLDTEIEQVNIETKSNADKIQANKKTLDTEMELVNIDTKSNADKIQANKKTLDTEMEQVKIDTKKMLDTEMKQLKSDTKTEILNSTPVGTVIGWLGGKYLPIPPEWQRCDGGQIFFGPMKGFKTPNLNSGGYFLRGALRTDAWTIQEDMIRQHGHNINDPGHNHTDSGHSHSITDPGHKHTDSGHSHEYYDKYDTGISEHGDDWINARNDNHNDEKRQTHSSTANILSAYTNIKVNTASASLSSEYTNIQAQDITGTSATTAAETRPKNIAVEWIIKIV